MGEPVGRSRQGQDGGELLSDGLSLAFGSDRLVMSRAFLQKLIDTAQALEGEVQYLRLKAAFETAVGNGRESAALPAGPNVG